MNIIDAIKSGEKIKRKGWDSWIFIADNIIVKYENEEQLYKPLFINDILANDWVTESMVKPPAYSITITKYGDKFICYETDNVKSKHNAFGKTREEALKNYLDKLNFNIKED